MLEIGSVIDNKYKIIYQIGRGGTSRVYLALNEAANKQWAIKEAKKDVVVNGIEIKQRLIAETSIMKNLRHPHLPEIADVLETDDSYLIVMDYIEGRTLKEILMQEGRQSQEDVVDWAIQLCEVLEYIHTRNPKIIYRDMKPVNIMLKPDGNVILIDFGAARIYKDGATEDTSALGTTGYAAPEQYGGAGQTDERTDIYNLGATMYHLVTGKDPSKPPYEMRPIRKWDRSLSSGLEEIILRCTKSDPDERYQSASDLKYALLHYKEMEDSYREKKRRQWMAVLTAAAVSAVSLVAAIGLRFHAVRLLNGTYDELLRKGRTQPETEQRVQAYEEAVRVDPGRGDAYTQLLDEVFLEDGVLTQEEADRMTKILGYKAPGWQKTAEDSFRNNEKAYSAFCYDLGLAFFYYYGNMGNKPLSRPWFETAKDSPTLDETKKTRAERFYRIAEYYSRLGDRNRSGDNVISYSEYWSDLLTLCRGDIVKQDNLRTALVVYREMAYQIESHAGEFRAAGVSRDEMESQVTSISRVIDENEETADGWDRVLIDEIRDNLDAAQRNIDITFSAEGEEDV